MHLPKLSHKHAVTQIREPYLADSAPAVRRAAENPQAEPTQKQLARLANATRMLLAQHQVNQAGHCRICRRSRWWRLPRRTCTIYAPFVDRTEHYLRDTNFMTPSASKIKLSTDRPQAQLRRVSPRPNRSSSTSKSSSSLPILPIRLDLEISHCWIRRFSSWGSHVTSRCPASAFSCHHKLGRISTMPEQPQLTCQSCAMITPHSGPST